MARFPIATLCRFFSAAHQKSDAKCRAFENRNFVAGKPPSFFRLCRAGGALRNGMTADCEDHFRYRGCGPCTDTKGQRRPMRAILRSLILCSAFALTAAQAAEPSSETIARGKALVIAGDCTSCHTADPAKPFAGGKRIDTPFGAITSPNITP